MSDAPFSFALSQGDLTPSGSYPHACWGCNHQHRDRILLAISDAFAVPQPASTASYTFSFPYCFYLFDNDFLTVADIEALGGLTLYPATPQVVEARVAAGHPDAADTRRIV